MWNYKQNMNIHNIFRAVDSDNVNIQPSCVSCEKRKSIRKMSDFSQFDQITYK